MQGSRLIWRRHSLRTWPWVMGRRRGVGLPGRLCCGGCRMSRGGSGELGSSERIVSMKKAASAAESPSALIDQRIKDLGDWRGKMLAKIRQLVKEADPEIVEEWKWRGVPTWYHGGIVCTGETYKSVV